MKSKWMHPMNIFSLVMIIIILVIGIGMLTTNINLELISGSNRTILGIIFLIYAIVRGVRFYQIIKAKDHEELL